MTHDERMILIRGVSAYVTVWKMPGLADLLTRAAKQQLELSKDEREVIAYLLKIAEVGVKDIENITSATTRLIGQIELTTNPRAAVKAALFAIRAEALKKQGDTDKI